MYGQSEQDLSSLEAQRQQVERLPLFVAPLMPTASRSAGTVAAVPLQQLCLPQPPLCHCRTLRSTTTTSDCSPA